MKRWTITVYLEDSEEFGPVKKDELHQSFDKAVRTIESQWNGITVTDWDVDEDE